MSKSVRTDDNKIRDKLPHGVVSIIVFHASGTSVNRVARLVKPFCKILILEIHRLVFEIDKDNQILTFLSFSITLNHTRCRNSTRKNLFWALYIFLSERHKQIHLLAHRNQLTEKLLFVGRTLSNITHSL